MIRYCTLICSIAGSVVYREKNKVGVGSSLRPKPTHEPSKSKFSSLKRLNSFSKRNSKESVEIKFKKDIEYEDIIGYGTVRIQNNTLDSFKEGRSMMMKYLSKDEKEIDDKFRKYVKCSTLLPEKLHNCFYLDVANVCITACESDNLSRPEDAENSEPTQKPRRPNSIYGNQNYTTKTDNKKWFTGSLRQKTKDKKPRTANSEPVGSHIFDKLEESAKLYVKFCNVITKIIETEKCNFVLYNIIKSLPSFVDFLHPRTEDDTIIKIDWWFFKLNYESSTENEMSKLYEKVAEDLRRNVMTLDLDHIQELVEKESEALNVKMMSHIVEVKRECMVQEKLNTNGASCNENDEPNDANNPESDVHEDNEPDLMTQEENGSIAQIDSDEDYLQKEKAFANMYKMYAANNGDIVSKRKKNGDDFEPDENYDIAMILESIAELLKTRGFNKNLFNKYLDMINGNTTMTSNLMLALLEISDSDAKYYAIDIIIENLIHTGSYICKLVTMKCMPANVVDYNRENYNKKFQHQYDESVKSSYRQLDYIDKPIKILCKEYIKSYSDSVVNFFTDPDYSKLVGTHNNITLCTIRNMLILLYNFYTLYSLQRNSF